VRLLQQSGIFPLKEFDTWDAITPKTYPALKTFIHEAYTRRLTVLQLRNTTGTQGYAPNNNQNMYNILDEGYERQRHRKNGDDTNCADHTDRGNDHGKPAGEHVRGGDNPLGNNQRHQPTLGKSAVNDDSNGYNVIQQRTRASTPSSSNLPCSPRPTVEYSPFRWTSEYRLHCQHKE
jgi:hypothetical protein